MSKLLLSVIIFIISNNLLAIVFGGSNLGMFGYSSHDCSKPYRPYQFNSQYEVDDYNNEVNYYINCIEEYLDNAKNDILRIQNKMNDAIDEANSL